MKYSIDIAELVLAYEVERLTSRQLAERYGVSFRTILRYLRSAGAKMRHAGYEPIEQCQSKEWLFDQYVTQAKSTTQIAAEIGSSSRSIATWLSRHGIEARATGAPKGHRRNSTPQARERMSLSHRDIFIGSNNPNWKGGVLYKDPDRQRYPAKKWIKSVKDRDGWKCQHCGADDRLHAHHIKRWRDYPELRYELSNGITLCHDCHEAAHGRGFKFRWKQVRQKPTSASAS